MSSSRRGGTKLLYCVGRGKMKGDMSVWHASHFWINARCATMSVPPFVMKYETCLYYTHLPYEEKGCTRTRVCLTLGPHALKFHAPRSLSLATLNNFSKSPLSPSLVLLSPEPPLHAILNPGPRACRHLVPSLGAHRRIIPGLRARCCLIPDLIGSPLLDLGFPTSPTVPPPPTFNPRCRCLPIRLHPEGLPMPPLLCLLIVMLLAFLSHRIICKRTDANCSPSPRSILGYRIHREVVTLSYL
jgi:hypothetical protein